MKGFGFDHLPARKTDPDTSKDAAEKVDTKKLETMVLHVIRNFGRDGCTTDDVCAALPNYGVQTLTPRFKPLLMKKLIEDTGERRAGKCGRKQRVVRAT